jgi:putative ABC transport system permease protein
VRLLRIAVRNTKRNTRRTAITVITVVIGVFVIVLARGIIKAFQNEMITNVIETKTGDIQIHKRGYRETLDILPLDLSFRSRDVFQAMSEVRGIEETSTRILFSGQLATLEESAVLFGQGVDAEKELAVCPRLKDKMVQGEFLAPTDRNHIVLTKDLCKSLKIDIGDTMLLFATSKEGAINAAELVLKGIFHSDLPGSKKNLGYIPLKTAQELLLMDGIVTEMVLKTETGCDIGEVVTEARHQLAGHDLDVNPWEEIEQGIRQMVENQGFLSVAVSVVLFIVVFSTVMNTMLMVVLERTGEIGTLMAIGFRRRHVLTLFLLEGLVKGLMGGIMGTVAGIASIFVLNFVGIPFRMPGATGGVSYIIRPELDLQIVLLAVLFSLAAAGLASLYPANRGSKMHPVEALRNV